MVNIAAVCLHGEDWRRGARFWAEALGYAPHPEAEDVVVPPDGDGPLLAVYGDATHLDLSTSGPEEQQAEIARLESIGAERVADWPYPKGADFVVMRDPVGNLFCVLDHD